MKKAFFCLILASGCGSDEVVIDDTGEISQGQETDTATVSVDLSGVIDAFCDNKREDMTETIYNSCKERCKTIDAFWCYRYAD